MIVVRGTTETTDHQTTGRIAVRIKINTRHGTITDSKRATVVITKVVIAGIVKEVTMTINITMASIITAPITRNSRATTGVEDILHIQNMNKAIVATLRSRKSMERSFQKRSMMTINSKHRVMGWCSIQLLRMLAVVIHSICGMTTMPNNQSRIIRVWLLKLQSRRCHKMSL